QCGIFSESSTARVGQGVVARGRAVRDHGQLDRTGTHHERADTAELSGGVPNDLRRDGNPSRLLGRTGGLAGNVRVGSLTTGTVRHGNGASRRWWIAALSVLKGFVMRQMVLVGFLQAQNCTTLASAWRHPDSRTDFTTAAYYQTIGQVLEAGKFQLAFFDD